MDVHILKGPQQHKLLLEVCHLPCKHEHLPCKHEGMSLNPQHPHKKLCMAVHVCNASIGDYRQVDPKNSLVNQSSQRHDELLLQ